jgi:hypothetical protein
MMGFRTNCKECLRKDKCVIDIVDGRCINYTLDNISHAQHRLFRSIMLPALTDALGESNNQYVHDMILKPEFIYRNTGEYYYKVESYKDIPEKHQGTARILSDYIYAESPVAKECIVYGYIPSMSKFTKKETKDYFLFCMTLLEEIGGSIPIDQNQEYKLLRQKVLKSDS